MSAQYNREVISSSRRIVGRQRMFAWHAVWLPGVLLVGLAGCGDGRPDRVQVSGHVLIDGEPLTTGNIKFVPEGARPSAGKIDKDGRFTLTCYDGNDGVIPGNHRVQISALQVLSESKVKWFAPQKYADFRTSGLVYEINEPTDSLKIELTWDGGKPFIQ